MPSLATAPRRITSTSARERAQRAWRPAGGGWVSRDVALAIGLAAGLTGLAFATTGGQTLGPNTWAEIVVVGLGVAIGMVIVIRGHPGATSGRTSLIAFAAVAGLTALSIAWSVAPDQSWIEAGRTAAYFAAFGGALALARFAPARWPALLGAIALTAVAVSTWAVLVKIFSWPIDGQTSLGRLLAPFGYWNATGLIAALGLPPVLWAASRRERGRAMRAVAVPAIALLATVVLLSYSRSALAAAIVGLAVPLALTQARLRAVLTLALSALAAAIIGVWALGDSALADDRVPAAARHAAGHTFGVLLLVVLSVFTVIGFLAAFATDRTSLSAATRRRISTALVVLMALVPVAGLGSLAVSARGLTGEVSHIWTSLTSVKKTVGDGPTRLTNVANSRPRYWREGLSVGEHHLLAGAGAGGFGVAYTRYSTAALSTNSVDHAHSYVMETFADFGLIGVGLNLLLLMAWARAASRTVRQHGPQRGRAAELTPAATSPERDGMCALLGVTAAFGVSSSIDWTWFYPGLAVPALICAGWLAGRGSLSAPALPRRARAGLSTRPGATLAVTVLLTLGVAVSYGLLQPLRSVNAVNAGIAAMTHQDVSLALSDARTASAEDPFAIEPYQELSAIYQALGDTARAEAALVHATTIQPQNAMPWTWLGQFALDKRQPIRALRALEQARRLDITNADTVENLTAAHIELRQATTAAEGSPSQRSRGRRASRA